MVHQWARFISDPNIPHHQAVKHALKYLNGTATQGLIMKPDPEKWIKCYVDTDFTDQWNQEEDKDPGLVLSKTVYVINYDNFPIIWSPSLGGLVIPLLIDEIPVCLPKYSDLWRIQWPLPERCSLQH